MLPALGPDTEVASSHGVSVKKVSVASNPTQQQLTDPPGRRELRKLLPFVCFATAEEDLQVETSCTSLKT